MFVISVCFSVNAQTFCDSAKSAVVINSQNGEIIYGHNQFDRLSMASTTKIMTCLIACESDKLYETVNITSDMLLSEGSSLGLKSGDKITLFDLVCGMLLASGNDAADATAIFLGESIEKFAEMMNEKAKQIGMNSTNFVTPSGLDSKNHYSTAYDMALLTSVALNNKVFASLCSKKCADILISGKKVTLYNHNKLLSRIDGCNGVKTGFTKKSGRCLVSSVTKNGLRLICVTLNDFDDWHDHEKLYEICFSKYQNISLYNEVYVDVVGGNKDKLKGISDETIMVKDKNLVTFKKKIFPFIYAPVKKGDEIGEVLCYYNGNLIKKVKIKAEEYIEYVE